MMTFCSALWTSPYLGHADPGFTLRTYTHLMPAAEDRAWQAVDRALTDTGRRAAADGAGGPDVAPGRR
jgi:hypothetical protein